MYVLTHSHHTTSNSPSALSTPTGHTGDCECRGINGTKKHATEIYIGSKTKSSRRLALDQWQHYDHGTRQCLETWADMAGEVLLATETTQRAEGPQC